MNFDEPVRTATWSMAAVSTIPDDARAAMIAAGVDPASLDAYALDGGITSMMACTIDGGVRCVFVGVKARNGNPLLNTLGTRFTLAGLEGGENYTTLYLAHLDDPELLQRVLIWPPNSAALTDFSDAAPPAEVEEKLRLLDQQARSRRIDAACEKGYLDAMRRAAPGHSTGPSMGPSTPPPENPPIKPIVRNPRENDSAPQAELEERVSPLAKRGEWTEARLIRGDGVALMDLFDSGWDSSGRFEGTTPIAMAPEARFDLRWPTFARHADWLLEKQRLGLRIDEHGMAHIECAKGWVEARPAKFVEWHLRAMAIHEDAAAMLNAITVGPLGAAGPALRIELGKAYTLELWPAPHRVEQCMLQPRIMDWEGRVLLDARGSGWGVRLEWISPWHEPIGPGMFALGLIPTYLYDKDRLGLATCELIVSLHERRVWRAPIDSEAYASGFLALSEFHKLLYDCKSVDMLRKWMDDRLVRSVMIPR